MSCSFTVTVTESQPPDITCPADVFATVLPGEPGTVVEFEMPAASDNCSDVTLVCDPPSGSVFPVGTTPVTCTATDSSGNTNSCTFVVTVTEGVPDVHDLALIRIKAPKRVTLNGGFPVTKRVVVTIQNRSPHTETIYDLAQLDQLVTLSVQSLDTGFCSDITPVLVDRSPQRRLPFNLRSKRTMNVYYDVTSIARSIPPKAPARRIFVTWPSSTTRPSILSERATHILTAIFVRARHWALIQIRMDVFGIGGAARRLVEVFSGMMC